MQAAVSEFRVHSSLHIFASFGGLVSRLVVGPDVLLPDLLLVLLLEVILLA
jgi:hypothetical protein